MKGRTKTVARIGRWLGLLLVVSGMVAFGAWWYGAGPFGTPVTVPASAGSDAGTPAGEGDAPARADGSQPDPVTGGTVSDAGDREGALELYRLGRLEEAAAALGAYLDLRPDDAEAAAALAQVQWLRGETESSSARYEAVLAQHGDDPDTLYQLALVLRTEGRLGEALESLDAALRLRPSATEFRVELARTLRLAGAFERAAVEWEAVIAALPVGDAALAGCYYELGLARVAAGDVPAARAAFERGAALRPADPAFAAQLEALGAGGVGS